VNLPFFTALLLPSGSHTTGKLALTPDQSDGGTSEFVTSADRALVRMREAAKQKDAAGLQSAFSDLTTACNTCHTAGGVSFIRIQTPTTLPFTNQHFQPSTR
ncbi:hypothetical protein CIW48_22980, partial [Methylobacterium sp. P1-11]